MTEPSPEPTVQFPPHLAPAQPPPYDPYNPPPPPSYPPTAQFPPVAPPGYGQPGYGQPAYGPPGYGPPVYAAPYNDSMNGFAVASFVLSFCGGLLSLIFGLIALRQIKRNGGRGRGLAIAGIVISCLWFLAIAGGVVYAIATDADRNASGQITSGGRVSVTDLKVGDCVNDIEEDKQVLSLPAVPCAQPHDAEVFAIFELTGSTFPGEAEVVSQVEPKCSDRLEQYAPAALNDPSIELYYFAPNETSWRRGDREVVCIAVDQTKQRTGSLRT